MTNAPRATDEHNKTKTAERRKWRIGRCSIRICARSARVDSRFAFRGARSLNRRLNSLCRALRNVEPMHLGREDAYGCEDVLLSDLDVDMARRDYRLGLRMRTISQAVESI